MLQLDLDYQLSFLGDDVEEIKNKGRNAEIINELKNKLMTLRSDHWSQPSAARTVLGLIITVNELAKDTLGFVHIAFMDTNLNIVMNCVDSKSFNPNIPADQIEFSAS